MMSLELHPLCILAREVFDYDAETGALIRRTAAGTRAITGVPSGRADRHGHVRVRFDGKEYAAHRLVWLHVTGQLPRGEIDHINGIRSDNRISNLRDVTHRVNLENRRCATKRNVSGVLGVTKRGGSYSARIKLNGKPVYLGSFGSAAEAHAAYLAAKRAHHEGCTL
jgi:hypothetical protein